MNDPKPQGIRHPWRFKAKVALKDSLKNFLNRCGINVARYPKVFLKHPRSCFEITFEWLLNYYWLTKKEAFFSSRSAPMTAWETTPFITLLGLGTQGVFLLNLSLLV